MALGKDQTLSTMFEERLAERDQGREIGQRARVSNLDRTQIRRSGVTLPRVLGLAITAGGPKTIVISWDHVPADWAFYEVQVASNAGFTADLVTYKVTQNTFEFSLGEGNVTYYTRVRASDPSGLLAGPYSVTLNTETGLVGTADIEVGAAAEFATFTKSSAFAVLDTDGESETYGPCSMDVYDADSVVRALIRINFDMACTFPDVGGGADANTKNQVIFTVLRRPSGGADTTIDTFQYDMHITYPISSGIPGRISIPSFSVYDTPGAGTFEYRVKIELNIAQGGASSVPTMSFQGVLLNLEVQQNKR